MNLLLFLFLASCAVRCDDSNNYYVIQMPEDDTPVLTSPRTPPFEVYWNVPTMQCSSKKIHFTNLFDKFGILQNSNDSFRGEKIAILYDPGFFPALFRNESSGKLRFRNGGVPQEGDLDLHLKAFRSVLDQSIPDKEFSGIGIIDFESWRPILRQNFGEVVPYKAVSYEIERDRHWWWPQQWIHDEAKKRFEDAARLFMQNTIAAAKQMRPRAKWGYYGFPYCFNMASNNMNQHCAKNVHGENDQIDWLWMESTALYPSVYSFKQLTTSQLTQLISGRIQEAARVRRTHTPILPYFWFRYKDGGFLTEADLQAALKTFNLSHASGFIIWGSSNDVNTVDKCQKLLNYIENVMGPAIAKYTKGNKQHDEANDVNIVAENEAVTDMTMVNDATTGIHTTETETESLENINTTTIKPALHDAIEDYVRLVDDETTDPTLENDSQELVIVQEELVQTDTNNQSIIEEKDTVLNKLNESVLIDLLLNTLFSNISKENQTIILNVEADKHPNNKINLKTTENALANSSDSTLREDIPLDIHLIKLSKDKMKGEPKHGLVNQATDSLQQSSLSGASQGTTENILETSTYLASNSIQGIAKNNEKDDENYNTKTSYAKTTENVFSKITDISTEGIPSNIETSTYLGNLPKQRLNKDGKKGKPKHDYVVLRSTELTTEFYDSPTTAENTLTTDTNGLKTTELYDKSIDLLLDSTHYIDYTTDESSTTSTTVVDYDVSTEIPLDPSINRKNRILKKISVEKQTEATSETTENYKSDRGYTTEKQSTNINEFISKDLRKGRPRIDREDLADDKAEFVDNLQSSSSIEQVTGSAHISRPKYLICIMFYFYSVSKCLCDLYGQCS
uniref:Hyaluronidase n=1 Tax=Pectinophora gossypiella TaxID=13191 RepID=A0A1E1W6F5_PECGO